MNRPMKYCAVLLSAVTVLAACVNQREQSKRDIQRFIQTATGEFVNDGGNTLVMVPVYARMKDSGTLPPQL